MNRTIGFDLHNATETEVRCLVAALEHRDELIETCDRLRAINEELVKALELTETAARRFTLGHDNSAPYVLRMCMQARAALAKAKGEQ